MYKHGGMHFKHPDCIDYSANINPFGMPERVKKAAVRGIEDSVYYPDTECVSLRKQIGQKEKITEKNIVIGNGAAELIFALCQTLRPKKALLAAPTFQEYEQALHSVQCECIYYDLQEERDFQLENREYINKITQDIDILFLCNPNNPTGELLNREQVTEIVETCNKYQVFCVIDECFLDFCKDGESMVSEWKVYDYLFILKAFTKLYAMPGLRLGYGLTGNERILSGMKENLQPWNISMPAQYAGIAALQETEYVKMSLQVIEMEKEYLLQEMKENKLCRKVYASKANYIFFQAEPELGQAMLERGFALRNCSNYRNLGEGFYRIAVRLHEDNEALIQCWKEWKSGWQK